MTTLQGGTIEGLQTQALFYLQKQFGKYIIEKFIKLFVVISTSVKYYGGQFFTSIIKKKVQVASAVGLFFEKK